MERTKQTKGITLVALVITIILLLILAGISILAITNQGLFAQEDEAKRKTENAQAEEGETLADYENAIGEYVSSTREQITVDKAEYEQLKADVASLKQQNMNSEYSTTETVVGKWIDGKPIYRKVIVTKVPTVKTHGTVAESTVEHNIADIENFTSISGILGEKAQPINQTLPADKSGCRIVANKTTIFLYCSIKSFSDLPATVILEYTKTTDTATNN